MTKFRYMCLAVGTCAVVTLGSCVGNTPNTANQTTHTATNTIPTTKQININSAILSELDKFESNLGVPALSNKIQINRPYGSLEDLANQKVISRLQHGHQSFFQLHQLKILTM